MSDNCSEQTTSPRRYQQSSEADVGLFIINK